MRKRIQQNLKTALQQLGYAMQYYIDNIGGNVHQNKAEITCTFGDGVLKDTEKEFQRRLLLTQGGYYTLLIYSVNLYVKLLSPVISLSVCRKKQIISSVSSSKV